MKSERKIIDSLFIDPHKTYHIRELARETKLNPNTVSKVTNKLKKEGILILNKKIHEVEIKNNLESYKYRKRKIIYNIEHILESNIIEKLIDFYNNPRCIVLMGSYLRGEDSKESDIDLVVITSQKNSPNLSKYEKILKRNIHLIKMSDKKDVSKEFYNNLVNGFILHGYLD